MTSQPSLLNSAALPLRSVQTIAGSALVVAPHPDDETLGCGGAIALLRALGYPVHVLVMSDGTLSHPRSLKYPAPRLQALREAETLHALSTLGVDAAEVTFLRLPDGSVPTSASPGIHEAVMRCRTYLETRLPETIFLPWRFDPHPDHRATWQLLRTALLDLISESPCSKGSRGSHPPYPNGSLRVIEYPIWDWDPEQQGDFSHLEHIVSWRLDIQTVLEKKLMAIAAYQSQTTNLIDDDPEGFQLTPEMLANFARPWEVYLEEIR
ncbi:PIG-L deacetylase family protein [Leptolyngbya sp. AN02str]|uniref:PIG-L deacetylase family protein n=1 Tax=Leptolyngbya sp. AN02str TaxID=3423363 RepID=UPI003D323B45